MRAVTIYTVNEAVTGKPYYVGATVQKLKDRMNAHRSNQFGIIWQLDIPSNIEALEVVYGREEAEQAEQYWIAQLRAWGFDLVNCKNARTPYKPRWYKAA